VTPVCTENAYDASSRDGMRHVKVFMARPGDRQLGTEFYSSVV